MEFYYLFKPSNCSIEKLQLELESKGLKNLFVIEGDEIFIGGFSRKKITTPNAICIERKEAAVDWHEQWSYFAENFFDGKAHIQIEDQTLLLEPGAGFGDLSHPSTSLMLQMLKPIAKESSIIDIGTGSGILALSSLLLGAKSAIGIDIDEKALTHARKNGQINRLCAHFTKNLPKEIPKDSIFLMNMTMHEQIALNPQRYNSYAKLWVISGVLASQREQYLHLTCKWGWKIQSEIVQSDWLGLIFSSYTKPGK